MITHNLVQGSQAWHEYRANHFNASDAPAMIGVSPYKSRTQLLDEYKTGITQEVDAATQNRFDNGHRFEALARPIAEQIIGEELSPIVGSEGKLSASYDGITFMLALAFEHKTLSERLASLAWTDNAEDFLQEDYLFQMEQQSMVAGCEKVLFMASRWDGNDNLIEERHCWYTPNLERRQRIIDGWSQFERDLANHQPREIKEAPKAEPVDAFPVPSIQVRGELMSCNLDAITPVFDKFLAETSTDLKTDDDFAQGEAHAKASREAAKTLKLKAKEVVDQIAPVSKVVRMLEGYAAKFDGLGLTLEKAVTQQKEAIKTSIALEARNAFAIHVADLERETHPIRLNIQTPDFGGAMKNKRTIASLHEAVDTLMAQAKIDAEQVARDVRSKLSHYKQAAAGYEFLFHDLQNIIQQPIEAFQIVVHGRIEQHKIAEVERIEAERKRIQQEEAARAQQATQQPAAPQPAPILDASAPAIAAIPQTKQVAIADTGATMKLGQIGELIGFSVTADFLRQIGFEPVGRERAAVLYRACDFIMICEAIGRHVLMVANHYEAKKVA